MSRSSPLLVRHPDKWPIVATAGGRNAAPRMFGRVVAWGGARVRPHAGCVRRDHPLPVAAGAATLFPIVVPALPRGPRHPSALRALGALPSFFVRLRRGGGGAGCYASGPPASAAGPRAPRP